MGLPSGISSNAGSEEVTGPSMVAPVRNKYTDFKFGTKLKKIYKTFHDKM